MKVLVVGNGGREYSILKKLSEESVELFAAKGNGGTRAFAKNIDIAPENIDALVEFAKENRIDLTIVGPENPLCLGIADRFEEEGLKIFGVKKNAAKFEASKDFTKEFLVRHNIPTARYATFFEYEKAVEYLSEINYPIVIKADGLCLGKGVTIAQNVEEAEAALRDVFVEEKMNSDRVVIEEFLDGNEVSAICMVSHNKIYPFEYARDYKKIGDGNRGPNTGGVGNIIPVEYMSEDLKCQIQKILDEISLGLEKDNFNYTGILFVGFMVVDKPYVLEFNVRFGDPETEVIMEKLDSSLIQLVEKAIEGTLTQDDFKYNDDYYTGVMMVSGGYPGNYEKGYEINGIEDVINSTVVHAGTSFEKGKFYTSGGRVLMVIGRGKNRAEATKMAYEDVEKIKFKDAYYRRDVGIWELWYQFLTRLE